MEITFDRASKLYEPGEKVTGIIYFKDFKVSEIENGDSGIKIIAESYMDTVSQIRGDAGRPPQPEERRIYFMKKPVVIKDLKPGTAPAPNAPIGGSKAQKTFEFILEATEKGEKLLDTYVGVEFSVLVSNQ